MNAVEQLLLAHHAELDLTSVGLGRAFDTSFLTPRFTTSRHVVVLVSAPGQAHPVLAIKIPRRPGDDSGVLHEAEVLGQVARLAPGLASAVPRVLGVLPVGAHRILVETVLAGEDLNPRRVQADLDRAVRAGLDVLTGLPVTAEAAANQGWFHRCVTGPLAALAAAVPDDVRMRTLVARTAQALAPLRTAALPAVLEHGDVGHPNLLLRSDGRLGVIDWERATVLGVPGCDLVFYLQYLAESVDSAYERPAQKAAFDRAFTGPDAWAADLLRTELAGRGVDPALAPLLVVLAFARAASTLTDRLGPAGDPAELLAALATDRDVALWEHTLDRLPPTG